MKLKALIILWFSLISAPVNADVIQDVPEAAGYTLIYELDIPNTAAFNFTGVNYLQDHSGDVDFTFDRVAYHLELQEPEGERRFVYVSLPTPVLLAAQTGIPHSGTGVVLQQYVQEMRVVSNHPSIQSTGTVNTGVIEFWPSNYATNNVYQIPNASDDLYDSGDQSLGGSGYGSMQIHDYATGQTLFAYNAWGSGGTPSDLGIGNNTATGSNIHPDWTFAQNAGSYVLKKLSVLVRPGEPPQGLSITVQSPQAHEVVQRQAGNVGRFQIGGQLHTPCESIQGRLIPIDLSGADTGTPTDWTVIEDSPSGASFSGALSASPGWYRMELRILNNARVIDTVEVKPLGVGEVFITAGQSNSANHGDFPTAPTDPRVSAWGPQGWQFATDPQPIATGEGGSPWPYLGSMLAQHWDMPVGFISVGWGGTSVDQWRPYSNVGLYDRLKLALNTLGPEGARAVLWHQGESDAASETTATEYAHRLGEVISASRALAGWDIPWGVAKAAFLPGLETNALNAVLQGQETVIQTDPLVFAGPNTEELIGIEWRYDEVHFNAAGLEAHASGWKDAILAYLESAGQTDTSEDEEDNPPASVDTEEEASTENECPESEETNEGCQSIGSSSTSLWSMLLMLLLIQRSRQRTF